ncbi:MAG: CMP-binding protein [Lysobacterales bacterium CG02_land_8_20_14_3_00_62_12]|nr:MAG: CMP-binding protein [Xanthomonadales bacterium CG02_land_8_20_14_3_00_62_12]
MQKILITSSKGGSGKTTVATNLAVAMAKAGRKVWLIDSDAQASTGDWVGVRADHQPGIALLASPNLGHGAGLGWNLCIPPATEVLLVDTPAGLRRDQIAEYLRRVDTVLVPLVPSAIDQRANMVFLNELKQASAVRSGAVRVGLIANRFKPRTLAGRDFIEQSPKLPFPLLTCLRDSQAYVYAAALGRGLFDFPGAALADARAEWQPVLAWLANTATTRSC